MRPLSFLFGLFIYRLETLFSNERNSLVFCYKIFLWTFFENDDLFHKSTRDDTADFSLPSEFGSARAGSTVWDERSSSRPRFN